MNLSQIQQKSKLAIIVVVAIIGVLIILVIFSFLSKDQKQTEDSQTTTETPIQSNNIVHPTTPPITKQASINDKKQQLLQKQVSENNGDITLIERSDFNIKYITSPDVFFVTIYQESVNTYKTAATNWFLDQNLQQQDLCDLNVRFRLASRALAQNNPSFSSLPEGC